LFHLAGQVSLGMALHVAPQRVGQGCAQRRLGHQGVGQDHGLVVDLLLAAHA